MDGFYKFNFRDSKIENKYAFTYNNVAGLPEYDANSKDYWGFYNGDQDTIYCGVDQSTFPNFHSAESLLGMLTKIENPLGGSTEFTYEGNVYKKKAKVDLSLGKVGIEELPGYSNFGPGCRVKQIKQVDIYGSPAVVKNYVYNNSYPASNPIGNSGVLNFDFVEDRIKINKCRDQWGMNDNYAFNNFELYNYSTKSHTEFTKMFKGGVVNYSTVIELNSDNSYTTFKYSNLDDTSYRDEIHCGYTSDNIYDDKNFRISSTDMDRGNLLSITFYDAGNEKVKEVINTFDFNPSRKNKFIKAHDRKILAHMGVSCDGGLVNLRAWAFKYYYYNTPLIKTEERLYNAEGEYASTETEYSYDGYGNLISKSQTTSDGGKITTDIKYNTHSDYNGNATDAIGLGLKNLLQQYGIKNYPVERITKKSAVNPAPGELPQVLGAELFIYDLNKPLSWQKYNTEFTEPVSVYDNSAAPTGFKSSTISSSNFVMDSRYKLQESITQFSSGANNTYPKVLTRINNSVPSATTWDYQGLLPNSRTQNAAYSEIAYAGFEGDYSGTGAEYKNGWNYTGNSFQIASPAKAMAGTGALTVSPSLTATAANAVIKTNLTLAGGKKYTLAFWATRPTGVEYYAANGNSVQFLNPKRILSNGWYYYETEVTAISGQPVGIVCYGTGGLANALIDEVMFCPSVASMQSLSYDTRRGQITAQNNGSGQILYFEYDGLGRMIKTTDEQGILIKTQEYKLQDN
ncbi:RHS Repeat protein [compost metagenome]